MYTLLIPPLQIGNTLVSDFKVNANIFSKFFVSQCVLLNNELTFPLSKVYDKY